MKKTINKKYSIKILAAMLLLLCSFTIGGVASRASVKSDMDNMVKYFRKGKYTKSRQYNNKLPQYASESCVNKIPQKLKNAYRGKIKNLYQKYGKNIYYMRGYSSDRGMSYYLTDLDNDKQAELIIRYYPKKDSDGWPTFEVYDYKGGKVVKLGNIVDDGFSKPVSYPGHKGLLFPFERKGIALDLYTFKNGKAKRKCLKNATYDYSITDQLPNYIRNSLVEYNIYGAASMDGPLK